MAMKTVDAVTLKNWLKNGEAILVDVREPAEYAASNIEGATLVPLAIVSKQTIPNTQGKKLVIHCHSGIRSKSACQRLVAEDPDLEIYNLEGGILAWANLKNPISAL